MSLFGGLKRARASAPFTIPLLSGVPQPAGRPMQSSLRSRPDGTSGSRQSWDELDAEGQAAFQRWVAGEQRPGADAEKQA
jgi:hypothetical protein